MKRDYDLIRRIFADVEAMPAGQRSQIGEFINDFNYPDCDFPIVREHIALLVDEGLLKGNIIRINSGPIIEIDDIELTWAGHDFIDAAKDDSIWNKAKESVLKPGASITFGLLLEWLKNEAKQKLGLP